MFGEGWESRFCTRVATHSLYRWLGTITSYGLYIYYINAKEIPIIIKVYYQQGAAYYYYAVIFNPSKKMVLVQYWQYWNILLYAVVVLVYEVVLFCFCY